MAFRFPQDIYQKLDGIDLKLLNEIEFLCRQQRKRNGAVYCCPGRQYLADKLGVDVGTISRHTTKLLELGVLDKVQRRRVRGIWQTCLYRLRSWQSWMLGRVAAIIRKASKFHRVRPDAHKASLERKIETPDPFFNRKIASNPTPNTLGQDLMSRWKDKGWISRE